MHQIPGSFVNSTGGTEFKCEPNFYHRPTPSDMKNDKCTPTKSSVSIEKSVVNYASEEGKSPYISISPAYFNEDSPSTSPQAYFDEDNRKVVIIS